MLEALVPLLAALMVLVLILVRGPAIEISDGERAYRLRTQAKALYHQGRVSEAVSVMEQAVDVLKKSAGPDHPDTRTAQKILSTLRQELSASPNDRV